VNKVIRKRLLSLSILLLIIFNILAALDLNTIMVSGAKYPAIYMEPALTVDPALTPGKNYTISIKTDYNGSDIQSWQLTLTYNSSVLHGVKVTNGDLITTAKHSMAMFMPGSFDNTAGKLSLTAAFFFFVLEPAPMTSGPGTLANVTFTVVGVGESNITIGPETRLIGYTENGIGDPYYIINAAAMSDHIGHGYFNNILPLIHDVAVTSLDAPAEAVLGEVVSINVTVANQGDFSETFDVTIYYDGITMETRTVMDLAPGAETTLTFIWNTAGMKEGTYTIKAEASLVVDEVDPNDNTFVDGTVTITTPVGLSTMVDLDPDTLNLESEGKWITCHIELPEGYNIEDINVSTILIDGSVSLAWGKTEGNALMVKFDRQAVIEFIREVLEITNGEVTLTITGKLYDGTTFEGGDTIKVIFKGRREPSQT